jgi:hypothetical protein
MVLQCRQDKHMYIDFDHCSNIFLDIDNLFLSNSRVHKLDQMCLAGNKMAQQFQQDIHMCIDFDHRLYIFSGLGSLFSNNNHSHNLDQKCLADNSMVQQYQQDIALLNYFFNLIKFFRMIKEY